MYSHGGTYDCGQPRAKTPPESGKNPSKESKKNSPPHRRSIRCSIIHCSSTTMECSFQAAVRGVNVPELNTGADEAVRKLNKAISAKRRKQAKSSGLHLFFLPLDGSLASALRCNRAIYYFNHWRWSM